MHDVAHDTDLRIAASGPGGLGVVTIDHVLPSQLSASVKSFSELSDLDPTPVHADAELHEMEFTCAGNVEVGVGMSRSVQDEPSQTSANGSK